jgi:putative restriction endonuclease
MDPPHYWSLACRVATQRFCSVERYLLTAKNTTAWVLMRFAPGDLVFSFVDTRIVAIGTVASYCYESPKPAEFGAVGMNWEAIGWRVRINFVSLLNRIRPKDHIELLRRVLPSCYSPLQESGNGIQSVYLTELPTAFAEVLIGLIGQEAGMLRDRMSESPVETSIQPENADVESWEHHIESKIESDPQISDTDRQTLIVARRGQGLFKQRVMEIEDHCRITGVTNPIHLRASHCKPWRDSTNSERLNGENGLLLTPTMDHLFDRGFISFEDSGTLIISPVAHTPSLNRMGIATDRIINVGGFSEGQRQFLEYHRDAVLLQSMH